MGLRNGVSVGRMAGEESGEDVFGGSGRAGPERGGGVADLHAVQARLRTGK